MRKAFMAPIFLAAALGLAYPSAPTAFAEEAVVQTINARLLPSLWFSDLKADEGKSLDVHAGMQNNSGLDFSGTAILYVDDVETGRKAFSSETGSLKDVFIVWKATPGNHVFQVKITASIPPTKDLISYRSDLAYMSVSKSVVFSEIKDTVVDSVSGAATGALEKADEIAGALVKGLESAKMTDAAKDSQQTASGSSTEGDSKPSFISSLLSNDQVASVYNAGIDVLAFLVHQWKWTLSVLMVFGLFMFLKAKAVF